MPTPTYTLIDSVTLASSASSVTFSGISATGKGDLVLVVDATPSTAAGLSLRFNGDTGNNFYYVLLEGISSGPRSAATYAPDISIGYVTTKFNATATVMDYSATDKHKSTLSRSGEADRVNATAGRWANTAAVTTLLVFLTSGTFNVGATFHLYQLVSE